MAKWDGFWAGIGDGGPGHLAAERNPQNRSEQLRIAASPVPSTRRRRTFEESSNNLLAAKATGLIIP